MQVARGRRSPSGALAEAAFDALAAGADLTVPHPRPLVDLERDDYADVEIAEPRTSQFEPVTAPFARPEEAPDVEPTARTRKRRGWSSSHVAAALVTVALGFGLGAGVALLLI